eukprot:scaffold1371_cov77-Skeletonema_dohrnii-CCMP3373.AAC.7
MMKLVSLLGLASAAAAAASSSAANPISSTMLKEATTSNRILEGDEGGEEDEGGDDNNNNANLAGYSLQYSTCLRTKIASDDDAVEGNSYYVNGAYRAQYNLYATF